MSEASASTGCCWTTSVPPASFPRLTTNHDCEVAVIGAGIVGLSAALALRQAGKTVTVLEALEVGEQVSGRSTAKISAQHGLIYHYLIDTFGRELAQAYADANREALETIARWIGEYRIDCDYQPQSAYAYANTPEGLAALRQEAEAARSLGFDARLLERAPLPFATSGALEFPGQAQFNPARYLVGLARALEAGGGQVYRRTRATGFEHDRRWRIAFDGGTLEADRVVLATHLPVETPVDYASPTQPRCHVAMAFRLEERARLPGMFIGIDPPTHSIRSGRDAEGPLLLVLGPRFNTGQDGDVARRFVELEDWARRHLPVAEAAWRWCNEDYDTPDRMPYVGEADPRKAPGLYVATGFNAWGISTGTAAGLAIAGEIVDGERPWGTLFAPDRPAAKDFNQGGDSQSRIDDPARLTPGSGGVIRRGEEHLAVWRDDDGQLHAVDAACTHMGCTVTWNNAERTWDCPCHGSIFRADGAVLHGPARQPLPKRTL
ncbi:FAD-dependent oxidoreductase [Pseudomonas aeruginosa]|nr:FAD-dependent oxidoreductase [Pseudomonas aeruginosa]